jgi:Ulp1 family protease
MVPIHSANHWSLVIIAFPGADPAGGEKAPIMMHLDSLSNPDKTSRDNNSEGPGMVNCVSICVCACVS